MAHTFDTSKQYVQIFEHDTLEIKEQKYFKAIEEHPEAKDYLLRNLFFVYLMEHQYDKALPCIQQAIECAPAGSKDLSDYYGCLSLCYSWMGDDKASIAAQEKSVELEADAESIIQLAQMYEEQKDYKKSVAMYAQAFYNPDKNFHDFENRTFYTYIDLYFEKDTEFPKAKKLLTKLLKAASTPEERACMYCALSYMYERWKDFPMSVDSARRAMELMPANYQVVLSLAESFAGSQQLQEAIEVFDQIVPIAEASPDREEMLHVYYNRTGELYISMNKFEEAVKCYEKDLELYSNIHRTYETLRQLAAIYYQQHQYALAKPYLLRIIETWPNCHTKAYSSLATYYLEVEEDAENGLNYLLKATQVNGQTPEKIKGNDAEEAATLNAYIGSVYYRRLQDETSAIEYYERALECGPKKEIEAEVCTALYEIYKKNGNEKRAAELKEKRTGPAMLLDMFSGDFQAPPPANLQARLNKPKNTKEEIEQLPYHYKKLPTESGQSLQYFLDLQEEFYEDLLNNPAYKEFFSKYNPKSVKNFCYEYAKHKRHLVELAKYDMDPDESSREMILRTDTEEIFELILQKKLWDKQLMWRAGKIKIKEVQIAYDFQIWENQIKECPFLDDVTPEEIAVMKEFLASDNFYAEPGGWLVGWQDYEKLIVRNEDDDFDHLPPWYEFYDERMGTGSLLLLPDLRGTKEKAYKQLYYKWKRSQPPDPVVKREPEPPYLGHLFGMDSDYVKFMELFENDYLCKLQQERMNYKNYPDKTYDEDGVREAIMELEHAETPVYLESGLVWHQAIVKAAMKYKNSRIADYLDTVYETYQMQKELNLIAPGDINIEHGHQSLHKMFLEEILKGKELSGEEGSEEF